MKVHQCRENEAHAYSAATSALHSAHIFPPLLCRCDLADSKNKGEICDVSPLLLVLLTGNKPLDFCIYTCVVSVIGSLKLLLKNSSFFQKNTRTVGLDRHSFPRVFFHFASLLLVILKKFGHTGIAGTKKWLDQAVFPCWSNYHTLVGE